MEDWAPDPWADLDEPLAHQEKGRFERYEVLSLLGEGGMAKVYLARRSDGEFDREVALKIIQPGLLRHQEALDRFRSERQILAQMEHPHIARLLDGGQTAEGVPFLVMEKVEGVPITQFCQDQDLSLEARLKLFAQVCSAVHAAHQHLVVHRDLKPTNILVTPEGEPKLLDFGIAKILKADPGLSLTQTGRNPLTPNYASPEQIGNRSLSTATDIYSLGVILYELLAGRRPFVSTNFSQLVYSICEQEPSKPSAVLEDTVPFDTEGSIQGWRPPEEFRRQLEGDLDAIVLKALRKLPEERYASAEQFAEDIGRFLDGLPVLAQRDSWRYRTAKFLRRNTAAVLLSTAALLALVGFSVHTIYQSGLLAEERDRAQGEQAKAERVSELLIGLFENADPTKTLGEELSARDILDQGLEQVQTDLAEGSPERTLLLGTLGKVYFNLGHLEKAAELQAEALQAIGSASTSFERVKVLKQFGKTVQNLGRFDEAETAFQQAVDLEGHHPGESLVFVDLRNDLATLNHDRGDFETAAALYDEVHEELVRLIGNRPVSAVKEGTELFELYRSLTMNYHNQGTVDESTDNYQQGILHYEKALEMKIEFFGRKHPSIAITLEALGNLYSSRSHWAEAIRLQEEALEIQRTVFGDDHFKTAAAAFNLAVSYKNTRRTEEALEQYFAVLDTFQKTYPPDHPYIALMFNNIGNIYLAQGQYEKALHLHEDAMAIRRKVDGERHQSVAQSLQNLALVNLELGNYPDAIQLISQSVEIFDEIYGSNHVVTQEAQLSRIEILYRTGRYDEAFKVSERTVDFFSKEAKDRVMTAATRFYQAKIRWDCCQDPKALSLARQSLEDAAGEDVTEYFDPEDVDAWISVHFE